MIVRAFSGGCSLLVIATLVVFSASAANGAQFRQLGSHLLVSGVIEKDDLKKFQKAMRQAGAEEITTVSLLSPGGALRAALGIGREIRARKLTTYARPGRCFSACGLIWLAGTNKVAHRDAKVGFHQAYGLDEGTSVPQANSLVGHYMANLNYNAKTSLFVTDAPPTSMRLLTRKDAVRLGITYQTRSLVARFPIAKRITYPKPNPRRNSLALEDGRRYWGGIRRSEPHGLGKMNWPNGDLYEGYFKNGLREGFGKYTLKAGGSYTGNWSADHREGFGAFHYRDGSKFTGYWKQGRKHGRGTYRFADGRTYSGVWRLGLKHGKGEFKDNSGNTQATTFDGGMDVRYALFKTDSRIRVQVNSFAVRNIAEYSLRRIKEDYGQWLKAAQDLMLPDPERRQRYAIMFDFADAKSAVEFCKNFRRTYQKCKFLISR